MTDEASSQPNDSSSGEPSLSTPSDAMGDAADAAAAAALIALPQPAAAAAGENAMAHGVINRCQCSNQL
jgi:hypothetical protein